MDFQAMQNEVELESIWNFIEKYYPNYFQSDEIAFINDIDKILNEAEEEGSEADKILVNKYKGNRNSRVLQLDKLETMNYLYEKSIENFIKQTQ